MFAFSGFKNGDGSVGHFFTTISQRYYSFTIAKLRCFIIYIHAYIFQAILFAALDLVAKNVFDEFDKDKSGKISAQELGSAVRMLGLNPTMKELQNVIKKIDRNGAF